MVDLKDVFVLTFFIKSFFCALSKKQSHLLFNLTSTQKGKIMVIFYFRLELLLLTKIDLREQVKMLSGQVALCTSSILNWFDLKKHDFFSCYLQRFGDIAGVFKVMSISISALEEGEVDTAYTTKLAKLATAEIISSKVILGLVFSVLLIWSLRAAEHIHKIEFSFMKFEVLSLIDYDGY